MKTSDAAKGQWDLIYKSFGLQIIPNKHQVCPICDRKGSSGIRIHDKTGNGDYICVCSSGNGLSLLMEVTGLPFADIAKQVDEIIGNTPDRNNLKPKLTGVQKKIASTSKPINGTWSEYYLKERGIVNLPTMSVHHCDSVPYFNGDGQKVGNYEAMVATVTDAQTLEILQQHITYLEGSKKIYRKVRNITGSSSYSQAPFKYAFSEKLYADMLKRSLSESGLEPEDIDLILDSNDFNHKNDEMEINAIKKILQNTESISPKKIIGNAFAASGFISIAIAAHMIKNKIGLNGKKIERILINSFSIGSEKFCIILEKI